MHLVSILIQSQLLIYSMMTLSQFGLFSSFSRAFLIAKHPKSQNYISSSFRYFSRRKSYEELQYQAAVRSLFNITNIKDFVEHLPEIAQENEKIGTKKKLSQYSLTLMSTKDDLKYLDKLFEILPESYFIGSTYYLTLIRCHSDSGNFEETFKNLEEAQKLPGGNLTHRYFQPILMGSLKHKNIKAFIKAFQMMIKLNIKPRGEQLVVLLNFYSQLKEEFHQQKELKDILENILETSKDNILGLYYEDMIKIVSEFNNQTIAEVEQSGFLLNSLKEINDPVISDVSLFHNGSILAFAPTYVNHIETLDEYLPSTANSNQILPFGLQSNAVSFIPQIYFSKEKIDQINKNKTVNNTFNLNPKVINSLDKLYNRSARLVTISPKSCVCPNCAEKISLFSLTSQEKTEIQKTIQDQIKERFPKEYVYFEKFSAWLQKQPPFDFIIDGANVAYHQQNHEYGRFTHIQILSIYNHFKQLGKRCLVILPKPYSHEITLIPNAIANSYPDREKLTKPSFADKAILKKLYDESVLYYVHSSLPDDYFWIYASVIYSDYNSYVISNDFIRNHKILLNVPKLFFRWKSNQIMTFDIAVPESIKTKLRENTPIESYYQVENPNDLKFNFYGPAKFSREIQQVENSNIWHFPSLDRNVWLCVNLDRNNTK